MITSRRDYLLRLIEEVGRLLARVTVLRGSRRELDALQAVVQACERLFALEADKLFQLTPAHHFVMLTEGEPSDAARAKVLLYAALNREAALAYTALGNQPMAQASLLNALRFTLKAQLAYGANNAPDYAPSVPELLDRLEGVPLDEELQELLHTTRRA